MSTLIPIYPAGPLGFSEAGRYFYEREFLPLLTRIGFDPLDPWKLTDPEIIDQALRLPYGIDQKNAWQDANKIIGKNNAEAIKKGRLVVAILDGTDVDSGTASEIGFAANMGRPIIGYRGDFRLSADNPGSIVNLQVEYFIALNGIEIRPISTNLIELEEVLVAWHKKLH